MNNDDLLFTPEELGELQYEDIPDCGKYAPQTPALVFIPSSPISLTTYSERICIRLNRAVLAELKQQAAEHGERYQTYINLILAQHAATTTARDRKNDDSPRDFSTS